MKINNLAMLLKSDIVDQLNSGIAEDKVRIPSTSNSIWELIGLVLLLIVILIATYYTTKFVGRVKGNQIKTGNFELIDSYRIAPNKMLQIIKVSDKYLVIAISKDTIEFITELEEDRVTLRDEVPTNKESFKKVFDIIKKKYEADKNK
ncbi:MAG TPA: flagellar biosynthetic protein FliO [Clostridiales bacterium]|nr:flagellar biosynthetic protein FliO [Clostridiales bacterium]